MTIHPSIDRDQETTAHDGRRLIVGIGELLWDLLPEGPQLGGAVSNFSVMAARLGDHAIIASRVGDDKLGHDALELLANLPVDSTYVQQDKNHVTGSVTVTLREGQPQYVIHEPVAWDYLEFTPQWLSLAQRADAVCFGTLAQRNPNSQRTIRGFLAETRPDCMRLLDVNLREPFCTTATLESSLHFATVLKMNDGEVAHVLQMLGLPHTWDTTPDALVSGARTLIGEFQLALICITMGGNGSLLIGPSQVDRHPGVPAQVVDTVGAGDTFTAALAHYYLRGASLSVLNEAGNRWGAWMASQHGAMPKLEDTQRDTITAAISQFAALPARKGSN
jgi:fructokinase